MDFFYRSIQVSNDYHNSFLEKVIQVFRDFVFSESQDECKSVKLETLIVITKIWPRLGRDT